MCKQTQQIGNTIYVDADHSEKVSLFDYFHSIELIPLETTPDVLVASISKVIVHQERYYALDIRQSIIYVFDQKGNFIFKIAKQGKGPGEYSFVQDININPFSNNLELLSPTGFLYIYDLSGNFIEMKQISYTGFHAVHQFAVVDSNIHVFYSMFQPQKVIYYNLNSKKLLHEEFEENQDIGSFGSKSFYQYQDNWYFFRPFHTCVYKIGSRKLEDFFQFDFGQYTREGTKAVFSEEAQHNRTKFIKETFDQFPYVIRTIRHNSKYILALLAWEDVDQRVNIMYNKFTQQCRFVSKFTESVEFEPSIATDEYVLSWCLWVDLEKCITKEMLDNTQKVIFENITQSEMETNPILIKYYFR